MAYPKGQVATSRQILIGLLPRGATIVINQRRVTTANAYFDVRVFDIHRTRITIQVAQVTGFLFDENSRTLKVPNISMNLRDHLTRVLAERLYDGDHAALRWQTDD